MQKKRDTLLEIKNLEVTFSSVKGKIKVVKGINYQVQKGEIVGIVGESGSGKSVSSSCILGLLPKNGSITCGEILFEGKNMAKFSEKEWINIRGKEIAMIFQDPMTSLDPIFTIGYQIEEVLRQHTSMNKKQRLQRICQLLNMVGISQPEKRRKQYPHEFSGGMRQRVMIAMALACNPKLLIADEPTTALDVTIQAQILKLLKELNKKLQMSIIFITHDLSVAAQICDKILVMYAGRIVEKGESFQILHRPQRDYTKRLLASMPQWEAVRKVRATAKNIFLDIQNLEKSYRRNQKVLDGVTFQIHEGEVFGLIGESGCGKSTLGRTILQLYEADSGKVLIGEEDLCVKSLKEMLLMRKRMQIVFQDPYASLDSHMTVGEIIGEGLDIHKLYKNKRERRIKILALLSQVGLQMEDYDRYPCEFSGGQRQRIGIARALAVEPEFMIWDEAVSALDVTIQAQILKLIEELQKQKNLTYLFISHDLLVVKQISDRIGVMYLGQIVEIADSQELFEHPGHPYTRLLLSSIPCVDGEIQSEKESVSSEIASIFHRPQGCPFHPRCRYVKECCRRQRPSLRLYGNNHLVACFEAYVS